MQFLEVALFLYRHWSHCGRGRTLNSTTFILIFISCLFIFLYIQLAKESQMVTSLELKSNTQKSRNAELEGSLEMAQENMTNIRKQSLLFQEKLGSLTKVK